jgi:hypothetical protein
MELEGTRIIALYRVPVNPFHERETMRYVLLAFVLLAGNAAASGLDDLRAVLAALNGDGSVRGTLQVQTEHGGNYRKVPGKSQARAEASVEDDANGLRLAWNRPLLQRAVEETGESVDREGVANAVNTASAMRIAHSLHFAPQLLQLLKGAIMKDDHTTTVEGKRVRELTLELPMPKIEMPKGFEMGHVIQISMDADGIPSAAMQEWRIMHRGDGGVITSDVKMKRKFSFAHIGSRLVLLGDDEEHLTQYNFLNEHFDEQRHNILTFTPER